MSWSSTTSSTAWSPEKLWGIQPSRGRSDDFPLVQADCRYRLVDVYQAAELHHQFTSFAEEPADVTYIFPLPPDASVHSFRAIIDGHAIDGVVKEKGEARAAFEEAISMNQQAGLLQQENIEIFKLMLGNVNPGQTIAVQISFSSLISHEGVNDNLRLTFPTSIAPRYGRPPGNSYLKSNTSVSNQSTLTFSLSVELGATITEIKSPSHPVSSVLGRATQEPDMDDGYSGGSGGFDVQKAYISLSSPAMLDKDIVVVLSCRNLDKQRCVVESYMNEDGSATDAYALTFVPRFKLPPLPRQEYIFLVDQSGSMEGAKMAAVRSALQIMLKSLPASGSTFNLISFGSHQSALWLNSMPYTTSNVQAASAHIDQMLANYGGTEMRHALAAAFGTRRPGEDLPVSVFVLTDGQCYDLDGVQSEIRGRIAQARGKSSFLRVFCMGIGDAVSKGMCTAIARAGNGSAVFVGETEKPDQKLMGLIRASAGPPVEDLRIEWGIEEAVHSAMDDYEMQSPAAPAWGQPSQEQGYGQASSMSLSMFDEEYDATKDSEATGAPSAGLDIQTYPPPHQKTTLLPGCRVSFFAIATRPPGMLAERSPVVKLSGTVMGQPMHLDAPVSPITPITGGKGMSPRLLHLIAARFLIQGHEDQVPLSDVTKAEIVRLGLKYGLSSSQTSFVAIDEVGQPRSLLFDNIAEMYSSGPQSAVFGASPGGLNAWKPRGRSSGDSVASRNSSGRFSIKQLPGLAVGSAWSNSDTAASPALSELSLHPQQHPSIQRYLEGSDAVVSSPVSADFSPLSALSSHTFGSPAAPRPAAPPVLGFSRRGIKKKQSSGESTATKVGSGTDHSLHSSVESLAREQAIDGSFAPSPALFILITGEANPAIPISLKEMEMDTSAKRTLWCTVLVVGYLRANFGEEEGAWSIFSEKALSWIGKTLREDGALQEEKVERIIKEMEESAKAAVVVVTQ